MTVRGDAASALALLPPNARGRYWRLVALQAATALLDLAGVLLFGLVGLLVISAASGDQAPGLAQQLLSGLGLAQADPTTVALAAGLVAGLLLIAKSALTLVVIGRVNLFLAAQATTVSTGLVHRFLAQGLVRVQSGQSQHTAMALSRGVSAAIVSALGSLNSIIADLFVMVVLAGALLFIDPALGLAAVCYFGAVSWAVQRQPGRRCGAPPRPITGPTWTA